MRIPFLDAALLGAAVLMQSTQADEDVCRALVLSGGANNGAWEIGVLWGLVNYGDPADFAYDVVTGVSVGSINALYLAGWPKGQEEEMVQGGSDLWRELVNKDVWKNWPLSPVQGLINKQGILDNRPLYDFLKGINDQYDQFYKRIVVSALDIETGQVNFFNQENTPVEEFYKAAFASTCIPGLFPPYEWTRDGVTQRFADNFIISNANPTSAIQQCLEVVDDPSKIIVDVLLLGKMPDFEVYDYHTTTKGWFGREKVSSDHKASISNYLRARDIRYQYRNSNSVTQMIRAYPQVNWRYILQQEQANSGIDQIKFDGETLWKLQENGRKVAKEALSWPSGASQVMYENWMSNEDIQAEYPSYQDYMNQFSQ